MLSLETNVSLQYIAENLLFLSLSWNEEIVFYVSNMEVIVNDTSESAPC